MLTLQEFFGFAKIIKFLKRAFNVIFNKLGFGQSADIKLKYFRTIQESTLSEAPEKNKKDKGNNGLLAEYECCYVLAKSLKEVGLKVTTNISQLKKLRDEKVKFYGAGLTKTEIKRALAQGQAIADSMFSSIVNSGKDLIFTSYEFVAEEHSFDVQPTGAQTSKGSTEDMKIIVTKMKAKDVVEEIKVSLKAYKGSGTSQGSKSSTAALTRMFMGKDKVTVAEFEKHFGKKGKEFTKLLKDFKDVGKEFYLDTPGKKIVKQAKAKAKKQGKIFKSVANPMRKGELAAYYIDKRGTRATYPLAKTFVELYNKGYKDLKTDRQWKTFADGIMFATGFDGITVYNAIADKNGVVTEVVNSNTSSAYSKLYEAFRKGAKVVLKSRPNSSGITVEVHYNGEVLKSLSLSMMYGDGTIQFKMNSKK